MADEIVRPHFWQGVAELRGQGIGLLQAVQRQIDSSEYPEVRALNAQDVVEIEAFSKSLFEHLIAAERVRQSFSKTLRERKLPNEGYKLDV